MMKILVFNLFLLLNQLRGYKMKTKEINIDILPEEAKKELLNYYDYLIKKYGIFKRQKKENIAKFAGILKNLKENPLEYQKKIRSEWD